MDANTHDRGHAATASPAPERIEDLTEWLDEHLCNIVAQGLLFPGDPAYRALTERPRFGCSHCGREAHRAENLCVPVSLDRSEAVVAAIPSKPSADRPD